MSNSPLFNRWSSVGAGFSTLGVALSHLPDWRSALVIVKPDTVIAWHRNAFRLFWTWKSHHGRPGRPAVPHHLRELIQRMSRENPLWGAPRIHGELLKLGIDVGETSVSKYMGRRRRPPSQTWRTFLNSHLTTTVSVDFFTVPTIRFQVLYVSSGCSTLVSMVQTSHLRKRDDPATVWPLHWPRHGRVLLQPEMRSASVIVGDERIQVATQGPLVDDDHMIEAFAPDRADHAFNVRALPG